MVNQEIADIFHQISLFLEMDGVPFKPQAYRNAALAIESISEDLREIYKKGGLEALNDIPGVGESIALKIEEYLKTGKIKYFEDLKKKIPVNIEELVAVEGIGPKAVKALWRHLKIKNLKDLENAAKKGLIRKLPNFGEKTEKNILQGIAFLKKTSGRFLLGDILPKVEEIESLLRNLKEVEKISVAGSVRRKKETIGDIDFLVVSKKSSKVMDYFCNLPGVIKIWGEGPTRSSVRFKDGFDADIRVVSKKSYGSALQYFTGSKEHNIAIRRLAIEKGLKLNEYGVFKGRKMIACQDEEEIYKILNLAYIKPEMRENRGEIEAASREFQGLSGGLPKLIDYQDIKGDLHCHSKWDGGANSIYEMAEEAIKMGYQYLGISDHTKFLRIEHGLDEKRLIMQRREIDKVNQKLKTKNYKLKILQGCEANILNDGSIDINDEALAKLDFVIAGIHSNFKMEKNKMTERMIKAMENPNVDIISHPTGRILMKRDEYQIDFDKILKKAKEKGTILEINSWPDRLDLNDVNIKKAKEAGVKMIINTDSHQRDQMRFIKFGIAQARRGWAEKEDIINSQSLEKLLSFLK